MTQQHQQETSAEMAAPAAEHWTLERLTNGPVYNLHYLLVVRHQTGAPSRVLLTSSDWMRVREAEEAVRRALGALTTSEFMELFSLGDGTAAQPSP